MQTPNGYSWKSEPWVSTGALVSRMNFSLVLSSDRLPGTRTGHLPTTGDHRGGAQPIALTSPPAGETSTGTLAEEQRLEHILLGTPASDRTRNAVLAQAGNTAMPRQAERDFLHGANAAADSSAEILPEASAVHGPDPKAAVITGLLLGSPEFERR